MFLDKPLKICATLIKLTFLDLQKGAQALLLKEAFLSQQFNSRPSCNYDGVKQEIQINWIMLLLALK